MMVELYHFWSSVCSVRIRMALEEKQVPWTSRYVDLFKFDQLRPEYLAINPEGVVPTLVHDGEIICDSAVINEYIDAAFGGVQLVHQLVQTRLFLRARLLLDGLLRRRRWRVAAVVTLAARQIHRAAELDRAVARPARPHLARWRHGGASSASTG